MRRSWPETKFGTETLGVDADEHDRSQHGAHEPLPERIGERYQVDVLLGRGGSAVVYRVLDQNTGNMLALKQLTAAGSDRRQQTAFEQEFHLLAQLSHPRVIAVYDYGVDKAGPYYTMELLDGSDLATLSPLPWRQACAFAYDVCSSLALLHSRRFVHRDISPYNVRCTRAGQAKLIDFGTVVPMGAAPYVVGTPACVAPEVVNRALLDARADLYSLGATLYYALTGHYAYEAHSFPELADRWLTKPFPPSAWVPEIPPGLDELVMALLSLEPGVRPRLAFVVMQRLSAIAGLSPSESVAVARAYLLAPIMVGRESLRAGIRTRLQGALGGRGGAIMLEGPLGAGCSRVLDSCALEAKTAGATILRARGFSGAEPFATVQQLLAEACENLADIARGVAVAQNVEQRLLAADGGGRACAPAALTQDPAPATLQADLTRFFCGLSEKQPLLIAVDDVHDVDAASLAFLAALALVAGKQQLLVLVAVESGAAMRDDEAFAVLQSGSERMRLGELSPGETTQLVASMFGDVPNVPLVSARIHEVAAGNPGRTLELAQWLVDQGAIRYASGAWSLPEQLRAADLPAGEHAAHDRQLARLGPLARKLAQLHALAVRDTLKHDDYVILARESESTVDHAALERALSELLLEQVLSSDGSSYKLASRALKQVLLLQLSAAEQRAGHAALARMYAALEHPEILAVNHLLRCGAERAALDSLQLHFVEEDARGDDVVTARPTLPFKHMAALYREALDLSERVGVTPRALRELQRRLVLVSVVGDDDNYWRAAPAWLENLRADSGLAEWQARSDLADPGQRLQHAFGIAFERFTTLPEEQRGYRPDEAIKFLVHYVVLSIAVSARSLVRGLVESLPPLLEPFMPLSATVAAMWLNARGSCEIQASQLTAACKHWSEVLEQLTKLSGDDLRYVDAIRNAIAFGIGSIEASLGIASATRWSQMLDQDPLQKVNAMYLRKIIALQQGDWDAADSFRKQAEILAVQALSRQMFTHMLPTELSAHARADDLIGVQHLTERIESVADQAENWRALRHLARGQFQRLRGDLEQAKLELERSVSLCDPRSVQPWPVMMAFCPAAAAYVEVLVELGESEQARTWAMNALATMRELAIDSAAWELQRALALAEGKLGDYPSAVARFDELIAEQCKLGVSGLHLGATYEARTRVAIWAGDAAAVDDYARLAAEQYRRGVGSPLAKRYERLVEDAERAGFMGLLPLSEAG